MSIPVGSLPGVQDTGPSALEQSLGALPTALQQTGALVQHTEELQAKQRYAQNLLDASTRQQDTRLRLQTLLSTLQEGPYQDLPAQFEQQGNALIEAQARDLNPQARALFVEKAKGDLVPLHAAALQTYSQRRDETTIQAVTTELQWFQQQYAQAGSDFERAYHRDSIEQLLSSFTASGLMKGAVATKVLTDLDQGMKITQAQNAVRLQPAQALQDIVTRMKQGTATNPAIQEVPPDQLPGLFDEAAKHLHQAVTLRASQDAQAKRQLQEQQNLRSGQYGKVVYKAGVTVPELLAVVPQINQDLDLQHLNEADHTRLMGHIQTVMHQLSEDRYKDRDVPGVAQDIAIRIETAQTPAELSYAAQMVEVNRGSLSSTRAQSLLARITERGDHNDPLNDAAAQQAMKTFLSGAFPGGIVPAVMDRIEDTIKSKISEGGDLLLQELRRIYTTEGRDAMRMQAPVVGSRFKDLFFPPSATQQGLVPAGLPPAFQGVANFEDALIVLDTLDLPQTAKRRLYMLAKESLPRRGSPGGVPQGTGLEMVPGVKKPKTPYPSMENR